MQNPKEPKPRKTAKDGRKEAVREDGQLNPGYAKILDAVCDELRASGGRGELTVKHYRDWTRRFFFFLQERELIVSDIKATHVKSFAGSYADKKPTTRQALAKALNTVMPLLQEAGYLKEAPPPLTKLGARSIVEPYILSEAEVTRLTEALEPMRTIDRERMSYTLVMTLLHTGLRAMELLKIKMEDIRYGGDRETKIVAIRVSRKWRMEGEIPISSVLDPILRDWISFRNAIADNESLRKSLKRSTNWAHSEHLFPGVKGGHLSYAGLYDIVRKLGPRMKVAGIHPHLFRHYFATALYTVGATPPTVMGLMGHRGIGSQSVYINHVNKEQQRAAIEKLGKAIPDGAS